MWLLSLSLILVVLALLVFFANLGSSIAAQKGHQENYYFWICLFCGIFGFVVVAALPDLELRRQLTEAVSQPAVEKSENKAPVVFSWQREQKAASNTVVRSDAPRKDCPHCGAKNKLENKTCFACGKDI